MKIFWLLLILPFSLFAQNKSWREIGIVNGLSQGMVFDMIQDHEGYIWMTTKNGLNRYDGYNFRVFTSHTTPAFALNTNQLSMLFEDSKNRLWIGTMSEGLNLYDKKTQRFYHCSLLNRQVKEAAVNAYVKEISEDADGNIWVGTMSGEVLKVVLSEELRKGGFPVQEDFTEKIKIEVVNPNSEAISLLKLLKNGKMLVGSAVSLGLIDTRANTYRPLQMPVFRKRTGKGFFEEKDGSFIIAMQGFLIKPFDD